MTVNEAQEQTLKVEGLDLTTPCFAHGQFYVACSGVSSANNLYVYSHQNKTKKLFTAKYHKTSYIYCS